MRADGIVLAFMAGVVHLVLLFIMGWTNGFVWIVFPVILAAGINAGLYLFFQPKYVWAYPLIFSFATTIAGVLSFLSGGQPASVIGTWLGLAGATIIAGLLGGYLAHFGRRNGSGAK